MTEEYIYERERELLDYFRNNLADPTTSRFTSTTDNFTSGSGSTNFVLTNTLVKNVSDTITVASVTKRKGSDFTVSYGEGSKTSSITLTTAAGSGEAVAIGYTYGSAMVEREYARTDTTLPRIVMMFLTGSEEFAGLGDAMEDGKGSYFNASYIFEIRDRYATRARELASKAFNLGRKLRHANLHRVIITESSDMQTFDYDREKEAYIWQFTLDITWDSIFDDA